MSVKKVLSISSLVLFFAFIYFSRLVEKNLFTQFDFDATVKLQDHLSHIVDLPFSMLSILGTAEITTLLWLALLIVMALKRYWLTSLSLFLFFSSVAIEIFGKLFVYHPAPPHLFYRGIIDFELPSHFVQTAYSYPSGHATRTTFLVTFLLGWMAFYAKGVKKVLGIAFLVGLLLAMLVSRVYLGEHWTSDVIGGFLLGASLGLISIITIPKPHQNLDKS